MVFTRGPNPDSLKHKLAKMILEDKDPEGAMEYLIGRYEDPLKSACAIHSNTAQVRRMIASNDENRNKNYVDLVETIAKKATLQGDQTKLANLLRAPLLSQHSVYMSKKPFLEDKELDKELHEVRPCKVVLYRFKLPDHIIEADRANRKQRMEGKHNHQNKDREAYHATHEEIEKWVTICRGVLAKPVNNIRQWHETAAALGLVTGRRNYEIVKTLEISPAQHAYQAIVKGICKRAFGDDRSYVIPLLCPYSEVEVALNALRAYRTITGDCAAASKSYDGITRACRRLFGRSLGHTDKRSIYLEHAYANKENNGYHVDDCSKEMWVTKALCHDCTFTPLSAYQAMNIE